jgi:hypothetical protein
MQHSITAAVAASSAYPHVEIGPKFNDADELMQPEGFRTWVCLGVPLTPDSLNNGAAGFPEYHNAYVELAAYQHYLEHGEWPEGTMMVKALQLTRAGRFDDGSTTEASGRGYFPAIPNGLDVSVKDSSRFRDTRSRGFFNFGRHAPPYAPVAEAAPKEAGAGCHMASVHEDMVFSDFYQQLQPLATGSR